MDPQPTHLESSRTDIILVGHFVPDDLLPEKLVAASVITGSQVKNAKFRSLLPGYVTDFEFEWGSLQVVPQRLVVQTAKAPYVRAADLAHRIAREIAKAPTLTMLGINREYQYKVPLALRNELGIRLSPTAAWGDWGKEIEADLQSAGTNSLTHGGLSSISMRQMNLSDREGGWIDVLVWPTGTTENDAGIGIRVNDHYQISEKMDSDSMSPDNHSASRTARLLDTLMANFDKSVKKADSIADGLIHQ